VCACGCVRRGVGVLTCQLLVESLLLWPFSWCVRVARPARLQRTHDSDRQRRQLGVRRVRPLALARSPHASLGVCAAVACVEGWP
jgi:hypothetical protein